MRLLLDTHSLIWFFSGHPNLSATARQLMEDTTQQKLISLASVWEMGIKQSKNKLTLSLPLEDYIKEKIKLEDFELLPIQLNHLGVIRYLLNKSGCTRCHNLEDRHQIFLGEWTQTSRFLRY